MIGRDEASRTGHVSHNDRRLSGNILSHVPCHEADIGVGGACRRIPDDEIDGLAAIEFFDGLGADRSGCKEKDRAGKSERAHLAKDAPPEPAGAALSKITCLIDFHVHALTRPATPTLSRPAITVLFVITACYKTNHMM